MKLRRSLRNVNFTYVLLFQFEVDSFRLVTLEGVNMFCSISMDSCDLVNITRFRYRITECYIIINWVYCSLRIRNYTLYHPLPFPKVEVNAHLLARHMKHKNKQPCMFRTFNSRKKMYLAGLLAI